MTTIFQVNLPGYHGEGDWHEVSAANYWQAPPYSHHIAAEEWVERNFAALDYPTKIEGLRVRVAGKSDFKVFDVSVGYMPTFSAVKRPPKDPA